MIAVEFGYAGSVKTIKQMYTHRDAAEDDYAKALRAYQAYLDEIRSDQRDKAAAFSEELKYFMNSEHISLPQSESLKILLNSSIPRIDDNHYDYFFITIT